MITDFIKKVVLGYSLPQEFACVELEKVSEPLQLALSVKGINTLLDVTDTHIFLGYKPLIIGIPVEQSSSFYHHISVSSEICLTFHSKDERSTIPWGDFFSRRKIVARIILTKKYFFQFDDSTCFLFVGVFATHKLLNNFNKLINRHREKWRRDRKNNINLSKNLADQVQAAYAIPRVISIITLAENERMNMFPTDLHGALGKNFYIGSLRQGGKANDQVEKNKHIVISRVNISWYKQAYELGKNHMHELKDFRNFEISSIKSARLNIPLPQAMTSYHELQQIQSTDIGIHRIHMYKVLNYFESTNVGTLSHIHRFYAQWRINHGKFTEFHWR